MSVIQISAIMAIYNPTKDIAMAIDSILSQTYPCNELILVNDGGDRTFIETVIPKDSRIKYFYKENEGIAATRNFAISKSNGEYIAFCDQDDYWYPEKLALQVEFLQNGSRPVLVVSPVDIVNECGEILPKNTVSSQKIYFKNAYSKNHLKDIAKANCIYSSTPLIQKKVFNEIGGFCSAAQPHDDYDMYLRIFLSGYKVCFFTQKALSVWRYHSTNESHNLKRMLSSRVVTFNRALQSCKNNAIIKTLKTQLATSLFKVLGISFYKKKRYALYLKAYLAVVRKHKYCGDFKAIRRFVNSAFVVILKKIIVLLNNNNRNHRSS